ncbi:MAG: hypothetical protein HFG50_11165 [Lachnospiraceae bacterium]|jgi:hypothetical protein|nr:hypothetical protein [Lachnospiraceae bacterium]
MNFLKRPYPLRRYLQPEIIRGYSSIPYEDLTLPMDVQTLSDEVITTPDGSKSVQRLKVFCDHKILVEDEHSQQKADRLWFQEKWFLCRSSRLSENTPLRHWTAEFVECLDAESGPDEGKGEHGKSTVRAGAGDER